MEYDAKLGDVSTSSLQCHIDDDKFSLLYPSVPCANVNVQDEVAVRDSSRECSVLNPASRQDECNATNPTFRENESCDIQDTVPPLTSNASDVECDKNKTSPSHSIDLHLDTTKHDSSQLVTTGVEHQQPINNNDSVSETCSNVQNTESTRIVNIGTESTEQLHFDLQCSPHVNSDKTNTEPLHYEVQGILPVDSNTEKTKQFQSLHSKVNNSTSHPQDNDKCEFSDLQQGDSELQHKDIHVNKEIAPLPLTGENNHPEYEFEGHIQMITGSWTDFQKSSDECFTKGCKWAPDGTCILTNSDDNILRVFDLPRELHCQETWTLGRTLPEMTPALKIRAGGQIYDYCWYPLMSSDDPLSCCLVSTSQHSPIHLWDAYTGAIRCTYRPYNDVDEIEHANSVAFSPSGEKLYCGFRNRVRVFDTCQPGRDCTTRSLKGCGRVICIISTICVNPVLQKLYVVGSYSRTIALCSEPDGKVLCLFCGQGGGVTHLAFSPDGSKLYAGCRKDSEILCWDLRNLGTVLYTMEREVENHQRIYFDISSDGHYLMSGGTNGKVTVWDLQQPPVSSSTNHPILPSLNRFQASNDSVNGISLHHQYPILATSSGQRHFGEVSDNSDDDDAASPLLKRRHIQRENGLKLWWLSKTSDPLSEV
ncbi:telomerase Cajal body protein 1 [Anabrus simplex]|uniref:telomerase Cajal body protein 1 n=1 Tax=Anabrus simplex TaxID=316456 RepID=UPI0035A2D02D